MSLPTNPKLDVKADDYYELVRQRMGLQNDERVKKAELIGMLKEMGLSSYETPDGIIVTLKEEEKLTAKRKKDDDTPGDEKEDEIDDSAK